MSAHYRAYPPKTPPPLTLCQQLVRLCDKKLEYTTSENAKRAWVTSTSIEEIMETTRNFVSFAVTDLKGKNDQINFITQFTLCIEKLPTKQHIYAYLLFVLMKKDYITLVNSILTDVLILLTKLFVNETDLIVFKNVLKFLCDCVNAYVFPLQSLSTIYNKLLLHVENQPRSAHSDSVAYLIITSITFLKNTEYRTTIMNKVKTYIDSTSSITHLKYHQIFYNKNK
ncbi:hypothetical protein QTN25_008612 [Entamoeba marina]